MCTRFVVGSLFSFDRVSKAFDHTSPWTHISLFLLSSPISNAFPSHRELGPFFLLPLLSFFFSFLIFFFLPFVPSPYQFRKSSKNSQKPPMQSIKTSPMQSMKAKALGRSLYLFPPLCKRMKASELSTPSSKSEWFLEPTMDKGRSSFFWMLLPLFIHLSSLLL